MSSQNQTGNVAVVKTKERSVDLSGHEPMSVTKPCWEVARRFSNKKEAIEWSKTASANGSKPYKGDFIVVGEE